MLQRLLGIMKTGIILHGRNDRHKARFSCFGDYFDVGITQEMPV